MLCFHVFLLYLKVSVYVHLHISLLCKDLYYKQGLHLTPHYHGMVVFAREKKETTCSLSLSHSLTCTPLQTKSLLSSCMPPELFFLHYSFLGLGEKKNQFELYQISIPIFITKSCFTFSKKKKNCFTRDGMCIQFHLQLTIDLNVIFDLLVDWQTRIES